MNKLYTSLKGIVVLMLMMCGAVGFGQSGQWTWVGGDSAKNQYGVYGVKGISSPLNKPGARGGGVTWKDANGNFWLFGGFGYAASGQPNHLNDIWKYNLNTKQWTWLKGDSIVSPQQVYGLRGVSSPLNKPSGRYSSIGWTDSGGNFWMFGGETIFLGTLNDLWKYNMSTNEWTWMKGDTITNQEGRYGTQGIGSPNNNPASVADAISYKDGDGNFWLFGGNKEVGGIQSDMWKYSTVTNEWAWMSGNTTSTDKKGFYGVQGVSSPATTPGARMASYSWIDSLGQFWLFGGGRNGYTLYSDLWKYNIVSNQWTWIKGDSTDSKNAVYGIRGIPNNANNPGAQDLGTSWVVNNGKFLLWGGRRLTLTKVGYLNDLSSYNSTTNEWVWVKGDSSLNGKGGYGVQGLSSPTNNPPSRRSAMQWTDNSGARWLFGGFGSDSTSGYYLNDLWKYTPDTTTFPLHLLTFTAKRTKRTNNTNLLNWTTTQEINTDRFEIERSSNRTEFNKIGIVKANSNTGQYNYTDNNPTTTPNTKPQTIFYRLKMLDKDGKFTYSPIRQINIDHSTLNIAIFPNPAKDNLQLQIESDRLKTINLQVVSQDGKVVLSKDVTVQQGVSLQNMNISKLVSGHCFLKAKRGENDVVVVGFEKL